MASFKWLTVRDVARKLDVHEETVRRWIRRGDLIALDLGGPRAGYRIRPADLDAFVRGGSGSTSGQPQSLDAGR